MAGPDDATPITPEGIAALVRFLPTLESPEFSVGEWRGGQKDSDGVIQMPWFELSDDAAAFVGELGRHGWVFVFGWTAWQEEARRLMEPGGVENAGVDDIRRLFTLLVRSDRFVEGQLAWAFESGLMTRIVRRLEALQ